jgi:DNA-binding transcriptional regulator YiaG
MLTRRGIVTAFYIVKFNASDLAPHIVTVHLQHIKENGRANELKQLVPFPVTSYTKAGGNEKTNCMQKSVGQEIIASLKEVIAWADGEAVPTRVTTVRVPTTNVRALRRKLGLSQSEFAANFGFQTATLKNKEQNPPRIRWKDLNHLRVDFTLTGGSEKLRVNGRADIL